MADIGPCMEWQGRRDANGYGRVGRNSWVHRVEWERHHGPIPAGMVVMHICDNRPCHRIDHLRIGTTQDNTADMNAKGRGRTNGFDARTHCVNGHLFDEVNTYLPPGGGRNCRTCHREWSKAYRARCGARR